MSELLYYISPEDLKPDVLKGLLVKHKEVKFVSLLGIDLGGNGTDEKIPIKNFLDNVDDFLKFGVQTDGSSVVLHGIATLNDARVDMIPDTEVKWFIDYNKDNGSEVVGTLRIPSFLIHNGQRVDSRAILKRAETYFKDSVKVLIEKSAPLNLSSELTAPEDIEDIILTSATELEFWVQTPEDKADIEKLSTSQILKEQYWKRTRGTVRTALEETLELMSKYGLSPEMGHKEVGGVKSKISGSGKFTQVMEQLEIDWKFSSCLQAADNELITREIVGDTFRRHGLEVTFAAKPIPGVAGSGEHTHVGVCAKLKNGKYINLFSPKEMTKDYLSEIGYGALMGLLKNYEVINPFVASTTDALNRLKPGFEAPVCIVASLGHSLETPSRNRSVLSGLVRDMDNPLATRFEVRSPNPRSNTYLLLAGIYQGMLDGINYALSSKKNTSELYVELSKKQGEEFSYLEVSREYRCEEDVFEHYTKEERDKLFGIPPVTVWDNLKSINDYKEKKEILLAGGVFTEDILNSYEAAMIDQWSTELEGRILPDNIEIIRSCFKLHDTVGIKDIDNIMWEKINSLRYYLMKDSITRKSLFTKLKDSIKNKDYDACSKLQIEMNERMDYLNELYTQYKRNLFNIS